MGPRQLVINADDFGFTPEVNSGIVEAHRNGILTAATIMANGDAFEDAVRWARETPTLDLGAHLALIQGASLLTGNPYPASPAELVRALAAGRLRPYDELRAQMERLTGAGLRITHLDTHKHAHLHPAVFRAVARLAVEFGVPWVRLPFDHPGNPVATPLQKRLTAAALRRLRPYYQSKLAAMGLRATRNFAGFQITGRFGAAELALALAALPEGSTEFMCHPGHAGAALERAATRLKASRLRELEALCSPAARQAVQSGQIELVSFSSLA